MTRPPKNLSHEEHATRLLSCFFRLTSREVARWMRRRNHVDRQILRRYLGADVWSHIL
jgi:hypothetical protein